MNQPTRTDGHDALQRYGEAMEAFGEALEDVVAAALALPSATNAEETLRLLETTLAARMRQAFDTTVAAHRLTDEGALMPWFKVDDSFYDHPKVFDAPDSAIALWVRAGCWAARNLTDGFVPVNLARRMCDDADTAVKELIERGLWEAVEANASHAASDSPQTASARRGMDGGGYRFRDWDDYQPSAEKVRDLRAKRAAAGRKGGVASGNTRRGGEANGEANASGGASAVLKQNRTPTRPDPDASKEASVSAHSAPPADKPQAEKRRGSRLPEDFAVDADMVAWARANCPLVDGRAVTEEFRDYWRSASGRTAVKRDWVAAWRNWLRKAQRDAQERAERRGVVSDRQVLADDVRCPRHPRQPADVCGICASERNGAPRE